MSRDKQKLIVGLVMPIAPIDGLGADHWLEVKKIIIDSLDENGSYDFETRIVSESDSVGLIHKRIVQGLYQSDIVICDVSCKNPNVMFELGMRLAFDKPTIIVKDDKTTYTFDAGVIEHLEYPRDLRFSKMVEFKQNLAQKVIATYLDSKKDPEHSPFLKSYGPFTSVKIEPTEVSSDTKILELLSELQSDVQKLRSNSINQKEVKKYNNFSVDNATHYINTFLDARFSNMAITREDIQLALKELRNDEMISHIPSSIVHDIAVTKIEDMLASSNPSDKKSS